MTNEFFENVSRILIRKAVHIFHIYKSGSVTSTFMLDPEGVLLQTCNLHRYLSVHKLQVCILVLIVFTPPEWQNAQMEIHLNLNRYP
jgi:hypothetical protein